jgi:hypothetical protein
MSSTLLIATEAPTPSVPPEPSCFATAFCFESTFDAALNETLPVADALAPPCRTASVSTSTRLSASEPAIPTVPEPLAPDVAS